MLPTTLLIASLSTLILGAPTAYNLKLHESRTDIPAGLSPTVVAPPASPLHLRIAFVQPSFTALEAMLSDVSPPSSANYGMHLSKKGVNSSSDSRDSVLVWVDIAGASKQYAGAKGAALLDGWIAASASVNDFNEHLDVNVSVFERDESGLHAIRTRSYCIPAELEGHLDSAHPTISSPNTSPHGDNNHAGDLDSSFDPFSLLNARARPPQVLTLRYSQNGDTPSSTLAALLCRIYAQLTARGTSLIVSSAKGSRSANCSTCVPTFPVSCPFVTFVDATQRLRPEPVTAVPGDTHSSASNRLGRALPAIAAHGTDCVIVVGWKTVRIDDAGCAGATSAALVALLNDRLIAAGWSPLGWLNPFLYSQGAAKFMGITAGSNPGCGTGGFPAKVGWDPVTGLGTPDFAKLLTAVGL